MIELLIILFILFLVPFSIMSFMHHSDAKGMMKIRYRHFKKIFSLTSDKWRMNDNCFTSFFQTICYDYKYHMMGQTFIDYILIRATISRHKKTVDMYEANELYNKMLKDIRKDIREVSDDLS